jgi:hypothetical protein
LLRLRKQSSPTTTLGRAPRALRAILIRQDQEDAADIKTQEVIEYLKSGKEYEDIHHEIKMFYDEI